jgi:hypothetical protein
MSVIRQYSAEPINPVFPLHNCGTNQAGGCRSLVANRDSQNSCLGFPVFIYGAGRKLAICMTHGLLVEVGAVAL